MGTTMRIIEMEPTRSFEHHSPRLGFQADLIDAIMRRIRPGLVTLLDMRTEFYVLPPGDLLSDLASAYEGPTAAIGLWLMCQIRHFATVILDPWTEFVPLD